MINYTSAHLNEYTYIEQKIRITMMYCLYGVREEITDVCSQIEYIYSLQDEEGHKNE
jgi:hypothetical protein